MKHKKWIRSIHLLRSGELSVEEQQALRAHLTTCKRCSIVYDQVQLDWIEVMGEITPDPVLSSPDQLTENIFAALGQSDSQATHRTQTNSSERELFFFRPGFRLGLQLASLCLLVLFFIEQFQVTHAIYRLEIQLQAQNTQPRYARIVMLPPGLKSRFLKMARGQLEQRGLPSNRIEALIHSMEINATDNDILLTGKDNLVPTESRLLNQWLTGRLKGINNYWRQP